MGVLHSVPPAVYVKPCSTCKPGPDGALTGVGWAGLVIGACVVLLGFGVALTRSRTESGSHSPTTRPAPVMDAVQREDFERRAEEETQSDTRFSSNEKLGWQVVGLGLVPLAFGLIVLGFTSSRINDDKSQLRLAATNLVAHAVSGPAACRQTAEQTRMMLPSSMASSPYMPSATDCEASPRKYAQGSGMSGDPGVYLDFAFIYSSAFDTNGEVTINDKENHRALCVTVPDTDVAAAQAGAAESTQSYPEFNDASVDPDPYITSGACPDAPIDSTGY
jgi:hypothetical protein